MLFKRPTQQLTKRLTKRLSSVFLGLLIIPASLHGATITVEEDGTGDYTEIADAVDVATCGDTVVVGPGEYAEVEILDSSSYPKDCRGGLPLIIKASNPAVGAWAAEAGAGPLSSACAIGSNPWDVECDRGTVSYVPRITGDDADSLGNIHIFGFETHYIAFTGNTGLGTTGCENCLIERNFFNVFFKRCLQLVDSDHTTVRGNRLYRCGGDDTGDQDIGGARSLGQILHHNDLYGSGYANGLGLGGTCTDWELCKDDFQGTDGWTVSDADQCGFHFHHNRLHHHSGRGDNPADDGDAIDLKHLDCAADPVHIYNNEIYENGGVAQVIFHNSARGVRFYGNAVRDGARFGVYFQAGQKCTDPTLPGMSNYRIFNNEILRNGEDGLYITHLNKCTTSSGVTYERTDTHDIKIFNNLFKDNVEAGLAVRWITDDGVARGSGTPLTNKAWVIANNIFIDNFASATATAQHFQVIFRDYYTAIQMEDYFTFTKNMVNGPLHFQKPSGGVDYVDVAAFDAAGYGYDNLVHAPTFADPAADDYRLLPPSIFDQGLDFSDILDPLDYATLPITDRGGAPRPEMKMNEIGPWEWCPDDDGDGLGICIDPQEGLVNRWYFVNTDLSGLVLPLPGHHFLPGFSQAPTLWQGVVPRFMQQVRVDGVVDESKAHPTIYGSVHPLPDPYGVAVELR